MSTNAMPVFSILKSRIIIFLGASILAACGSPLVEKPAAVSDGSDRTRIGLPETARDATSTAVTPESYKKDVAQRIVQVNSTHVYTSRPQALLRSVIVVKYIVDSQGNLVRSEILRSNRDRDAETIAMASLKNTAPFPKPAPNLLHHGRIELSESWLFNNDGRFQLRSIALPQMNE